MEFFGYVESKKVIAMMRRHQRSSIVRCWGPSLLLAVLALFQIGLAPAQPLAAGRGKFLGAGTSNPVWTNFKLYWNQLTPGNDGKWGSVEGTRGNYNWTNLDAIYSYATSNSLPFKEHTLIWGNQQPSWITGLDSAQQRAAIVQWIDTLGQRYGYTVLVDVVNEPFHAPPSYMNALGGSGATGWDWVITAFQLARSAYFPGVKLLLNEYNVLGNNTAATNFINLITLLKNRGLIDGVGIQGHYFEFRSEVAATSNIYVYDINTIKANLDRIAQVGLPIYMTEFDIDEPVDSVQLAQYKIYFPIFWTHPAVKGITLWGYIQNDVWTAHPNTYLLLSNGTERPAMRWLKNFVAIPFPPVAVSPSGTTGEPLTPLLHWSPSATAKSYHVQLASIGAFSSPLLDTTVADTTFLVDSLAPGATYYWHVSAANDSGESAFSATVSFTTAGQSAGVSEPGTMPPKYALSQNYPNPFNPTTAISYSVPPSAGRDLDRSSSGGSVGQLPAVGHVTLKVFDMLGREVMTLVDGVRAPGTYTVTIDGNSLASGVYVCRLQAEGVSLARKLVLLK